MMEEEWLTDLRPRVVLSLVKSNYPFALSVRKNRLFACGCYRLIWEKITLEEIRAVVVLAELCADRQLAQKKLSVMGHRALQSVSVPVEHATDIDLLRHSAALLGTTINPNRVAQLTWFAVDPEYRNQHMISYICPEQAGLVRCVYGNPFRPVAFDPKWRTEHTVGLALRMYDDREFAVMPILADALEEAGCDTADILTHCREPGVHVRGCWVVDLVLGKSGSG